MIIVWSNSLGSAAFLGLAALVLVNRPLGATGWRVLALCLGTAIWAALAAIQVWWMPGVAHTFEDVRSWLWLDFLLITLTGPAGKNHNIELMRLAVAVVMVTVGIVDAACIADTASPVDFQPIQCYTRISVAILGLLLVENIYRNAVPGEKWNITPFCIAVAGIFGFDFYTFADAIVQHSVRVSLLATRGIVLFMVAPLLLLTLSRNIGWHVHVHVSRRIVFHTATLTLGGTFLLVTATIASLLGYIVGPWREVFQASVFVAGVLAFVVVASIASLRSNVRNFINEHFFSRRYDYRLEWLHFVDTISSSDDNSPLQQRVIRAIADVVDSPGGVLWVGDFDGQYRLACSLNMSVDAVFSESPDGAFVTAFNNGTAVQEFRRPNDPSSNNSDQPAWALPQHPVWLAIPLVQKNSLLGFIALAPPRAPQSLNWESFDLLRTIGRQAASYLAEERSALALADARAVLDYSKEFGFIAHDVKNISGQLTMLVANIAKFGDNPQFRADMIRTLQHAASKLGRLVELPAKSAVVSVDAIDPVPIVESVAKTFQVNGRNLSLDSTNDAVPVTMSAAKLESAVTHLLANAFEASKPGDPVTVRVRCPGDMVSIAIEDRGTGMDEAFVRDVLFAPRRSTKPNGHGMGAYQAREIVRGAGGNIKVESVVGQGTVMQILLPRAPRDEQEVRHKTPLLR